LDVTYHLLGTSPSHVNLLEVGALGCKHVRQRCGHIDRGCGRASEALELSDISLVEAIESRFSLLHGGNPRVELCLKLCNHGGLLRHLLLGRRLQCAGTLLQPLLVGKRLVKHRLHRIQLRLRLGQLGVGGAQLALGQLERLLLGLDDLGDAAVNDHRTRPRAQARQRACDVLGVLRREVWRGEVRVEQLDRLVVDAVLVETLQRAEEANIGHHGARILPRALELRDGTALGLDDHRGGWHDVFLEEDEHSVEDALHEIGWLLELLQQANILGRDRLERVHGGVQRRLGSEQVLLAFSFLRVDHLRLAGKRVLHSLHLGLFLLESDVDRVWEHRDVAFTALELGLLLFSESGRHLPTRLLLRRE